MGIAVFAAILAVLCIAGFLLIYLNGIEGREPAARFGETDLAHRREVHFLFPRITKR